MLLTPSWKPSQLRLSARLKPLVALDDLESQILLVDEHPYFHEPAIDGEIGLRDELEREVRFAALRIRVRCPRQGGESRFVVGRLADRNHRTSREHPWMILEKPRSEPEQARQLGLVGRLAVLLLRRHKIVRYTLPELLQHWPQQSPRLFGQAGRAALLDVDQHKPITAPGPFVLLCDVDSVLESALLPCVPVGRQVGGRPRMFIACRLAAPSWSLVAFLASRGSLETRVGAT